MLRAKVFTPTDPLPPGLIEPAEQTHETKIIEVRTGREDTAGVDGLWTRDRTKILAVRVADCAGVVFIEKSGEKFGVVHAGWRGLVAGAIEKMAENFEDPEIFVGPLLSKFGIFRDDCFEKIRARFGDKFFTDAPDDPGRVIFDFEAAVRSVVPGAKFDGRSTGSAPELASWRRDRTALRNRVAVGDFGDFSEG